MGLLTAEGYFLLCFVRQGSLCSPGGPETCSVDQAVPELRDLPTSAC